MKIPLVDICDFKGGTQPPKDEWIDHEEPGYIRMLQIRDFTQSEKNNIEYVKDTSNLKKCTPDDILIGRYGASVGKILTGLSGAYNVAIVKTVPNKEKVCPQFLFHYFNAPYFQNHISSVGSRAAQAGFNKDDLGKLYFPLLPLDEQRRIAAVLDKVSGLIDKRREQLDKLDELVKARFVEMFGDPVSNPKGWNNGTIRDVVSEVKYGTSRPAVDGGTYKYLRMGNITFDGHLDLSDLKYIDIPDSELEKCMVRKGDVLFNRTNSKELVGKTCVFDLDEPMVIAGYIIRVRVNKKVLPIYLSAVLNSQYGKQILADMCKAIVGQANINAQELQDIAILIPPIELQEKFSNSVETVKKSKLTIQQSLDKLEVLKKALMQQYFG